MAKRTRTSSADVIPYTPDEWNDSQLALHRAENLDDAFRAASCLAGGWYRRPVTIDMQIVGADEHYMMRPAEVAPLAGWEPVYTISRVA